MTLTGMGSMGIATDSSHVFVLLKIHVGYNFLTLRLKSEYQTPILRVRHVNDVDLYLLATFLTYSY